MLTVVQKHCLWSIFCQKNGKQCTLYIIFHFSLFLCLYYPPSLSHSLYHFFTLSFSFPLLISLPFSITLHLLVCLSVFLFIHFFLFFSLSMYHFFLPLSHFFFISAQVCFPIYWCRYFFLPFFPSDCPFFSDFLCLSLCLLLSLSAHLWTSLFLSRPTGN